MAKALPSKVNPDLENERNKSTFNVEEFARWWNGGEAALYKKRELENIIFNDPEIETKVPLAYLSHKELYEESIRKSVAIFKKIKSLDVLNGDPNYMDTVELVIGNAMMRNGLPMNVHWSMFLPCLEGQATKEQQDKWMTKAKKMSILGTYAQTELGHGTFIRGLETQATYDEKTKEFVLNSPTITSLKWWPGGLGQTVNYAIVIAQLYTKGKCHGIHPFMVQLRNEDTWEPMAGITIGEIGPKLGLNAYNNGFLGFKNVRIPRENMLMRNAQVLEDGTFVKAPLSVLTYGTMVFVRVIIVSGIADNVCKAATIATRYSAVRRQSPIEADQIEPQIIDHVTQQNKLFPNIARGVVFKLAADYIWNLYKQITLELGEGNLERLPEFHALTCCLKAVCTADGMSAVETLRLACGGHGFLESSNLPATYGTVTAACTYEGENTVLLLQTARFLIKSWSQALKGATLVPTVAYLYSAKNQSRSTWDSSLLGIIHALQSVAANKVRLAYENVERRKTSGYSVEVATNMTSIELAQAAEAHCRAYLVQSSYEIAKGFGSHVSHSLATVLNQLIELYAVETCLKSMADLIRFAGLTETDVHELQARLENILTRIRPNAVGIVDGFDIPDQIIDSTLGAYDGNVYERLFAEAQKSPLNQDTSNKAFNLYLKPFLKSNL